MRQRKQFVDDPKQCQPACRKHTKGLFEGMAPLSERIAITVWNCKQNCLTTTYANTVTMKAIIPMVPSAKAIASHRPEEHMKEDIHNNKGNIENSVESFLLAALLECAGRDDFNFLNNSITMKNAILYATNDLIAYMQKDPAAKSNATLLLSTSTPYTAVLHYRLANFIEKYIESNHQPFVDPLLPAKISRRGKILSGAEIHHKSRIGKRFVLGIL